VTGTVSYFLNNHNNNKSEVIDMNVICTINDKKKNESGMAAMGDVKKQ
jgi:hypothetical protein